MKKLDYILLAMALLAIGLAVTFKVSNKNLGFNVRSNFNISAFTTSTLSRTILGGQATILTAVATSTMDSGQICDSSFISIQPVSTTPTLTLPSTTTLFANCLPNNGNYIEVTLLSVTTSSLFSAGTGGTLYANSSNVLTANKIDTLRILRDSNTTYRAILTNAAAI